MDADKVAERLTEHTGVEWEPEGNGAKLEVDDPRGIADVGGWWVGPFVNQFDDLWKAERLTYLSARRFGELQSTKGTPTDAIDALTCMLGFGPADEVGGDGRTTLDELLQEAFDEDTRECIRLDATIEALSLTADQIEDGAEAPIEADGLRKAVEYLDELQSRRAEESAHEAARQCEGFGDSGSDTSDAPTMDANGPTLVLEPKEGETIRIEPDDAPVTMHPHDLFDAFQSHVITPAFRGGIVCARIRFKGGQWTLHAKGDRQIRADQEWYGGIKLGDFDRFALDNIAYEVRMEVD